MKLCEQVKMFSFKSNLAEYFGILLVLQKQDALKNPLLSKWVFWRREGDSNP